MEFEFVGCRFVEQERQFAVQIVLCRDAVVVEGIRVCGVALTEEGAFVYIEWYELQVLDLFGMSVDIEQSDDASVGVFPSLVADEVAQRIDDGYLTSVGSGECFLILYDMRMAADDDIEAEISQPLCEAMLVGIVQELVFGAPVYEHDSQIDGSVLEAMGDVLFYLFGVDIIDDIRCYRRYLIGAISSVEYGDFQPCDMDKDRILFFALFGVDVCTHGRILAHEFECTLQARLSRVVDMVVSQSKDIESSIGQRIEEGVGCTESGVSAVFVSGEGGFDIDDIDIGLTDVWLQVSEVGFVVIASCM